MCDFVLKSWKGMVFKVKRIISLILTMAMVLSILPLTVQAQSLTAQGPIAPPENWTQYSPMERLFRVSGSNKTFILLDKSEDGYLVFSYDDYGKKAFDESSGIVFDINNKSNIGYFLNNEFLTEGYMDTTVNELKKMPAEITEYLNEHTWETEPATASASSTSQRAKVALMSQTEYVQYAGKFGVKDNSRTWMFRTARALTSDGKSILRYFDETSGHFTSSWPSNTALYIRPLFYLDETFFTSVKLNSAYMGSEVKKLVGSASTQQLSSVGYTQSEIEMILNSAENSVLNASIEFPEETVYEQETYCNVVVSSNGSYELTVSGDGTGSISLSGRDVSVVSKKCNIVIDGSGKKNLIFTLKKDGVVIESMRKEVFCADVYNDRELDSNSVRGVFLDLPNTLSNTDITVLKSMGTKNVRLDFSWMLIEPEEQTYDFSAYESAVEKLVSSGIAVHIVLSDDNEIYSGEQKEDALSAVVEAIISKFPSVSTIELPKATDTTAYIVGNSSDNRFFEFQGYDSAVKWFRPFFEIVNSGDIITKFIDAEKLQPNHIWVLYSNILDENSQTTTIFNDISKINQHTQGYLTSLKIGDDTGYITTEGLKVIGNGNYANSKIITPLNNGMNIFDGFSKQDAVNLISTSVASEINDFINKYQDVFSTSTQTMRMLYRLEQAEIYFQQLDINAKDCTGIINQIGEVGTYFCNVFKNGGITVAQDKMSVILTELYEIFKHSAAICVFFENSYKDSMASVSDFNLLTEGKNSKDPLVRSAYIHCETIKNCGARAELEKSYVAVGYYDLILKHLCQWAEALLKGDSSVYELFEIKDDVLSLEGICDYPNEMVTITVKKHLEEENQYELDYLGQTKANENGEYTCSYKIKNESGIYTLSVRTGNNNIYHREFMFFSKTDEDDLIASIKASSNSNDVLSAINKYSAIIRLYSEELAGITADDKTVISRILSHKSEINSIDKLINLTNEALLLDELHNAKSTTQVKTIIERYAYLLKLEMRNSWKTYTNLFNESTQNKVLDELAEKDFASGDDITVAFDTAVILKGVEGLSYREVMSLLTTNNNILNIDFSDYNKLTLDNKNSMLKTIAGVSYSSVVELKEDFESKAENYQNTKEPPYYPGGGGGGLSSGSKNYLGGVNVSPPANMNESQMQDGFNDMAGFEWASEPVKALCESNVINGVGGNRFEPDRAVRREEFVKMIVLAFDFEIPQNQELQFVDVSDDDWAASYIISAVSNGIITGETETIFGYGKPITREDAAVILYRVANMKNIVAAANDSSFTDYEMVSGYAKTAVANMSGAGIINGMGDGTFMPKEITNRAQAAKLIYELLKRK
jgi:hypothetical protein